MDHALANSDDLGSPFHLRCFLFLLLVKNQDRGEPSVLSSSISTYEWIWIR